MCKIRLRGKTFVEYDRTRILHRPKGCELHTSSAPGLGLVAPIITSIREGRQARYARHSKYKLTSDSHLPMSSHQPSTPIGSSRCRNNHARDVSGQEG